MSFGKSCRAASEERAVKTVKQFCVAAQRVGRRKKCLEPESLLWFTFFMLILVAVFIAVSYPALANRDISLTVTYDPQTSPHWDLKSVLAFSAELGNVAISSRTVFSLDGYESQVFTGAWTVDIWQFYCELSFVPLAVGFDHWSSTATLSLPGVTMESTFYFSHTESGSYSNFRLLSTIVETEITVELGFAGYGFNYSHTEIVVSGVEGPCAENLSLELRLAKRGFDYFKIRLQGFSLPGITIASADLEAEFTLARKDVTVELRADSPWAVAPCLSVYFSLGAGTSGTSLTIGSLDIYGLELTCEVDGLEFRSVSVLNPAYAATLLGTSKEGYWELIELSMVQNPECCTSGVNWGAKTFFSRSSDELFGWAETVVALEIALQEQIAIGLEVDLTVNGLEQLRTTVRTFW